MSIRDARNLSVLLSSKWMERFNLDYACMHMVGYSYMLILPECFCSIYKLSFGEGLYRGFIPSLVTLDFSHSQPEYLII